MVSWVLPKGLLWSPIGMPSAESHLLRKMYFAYILKSLKDNKYYYGSTSDIESRLKQHNYGKVRSTKSRIPFILHYSEQFENKSDAFEKRIILQINRRIYLAEGK